MVAQTHFIHTPYPTPTPPHPTPPSPPTHTIILLVHSLRLCGRDYQYLYDKGVKPNAVLFAPDPSGPPGVRTMDEFVLSVPFGDYSKCKKAKIGDRMSLSFTTTRPVMMLQESNFVAIPEVMSDGKIGFPFSDGVGVMGAGIARKIRDTRGVMGGGRGAMMPGAVQVRIGGVKGMLTLKLDFPENKIGIRPSMVKFSSAHMFLDVKAIARWNQGRDEHSGGVGRELFNQLVIVLDHLGVKTEVFSQLQRQQLVKALFTKEMHRAAKANHESLRRAVETERSVRIDWRKRFNEDTLASLDTLLSFGYYEDDLLKSKGQKIELGHDELKKIVGELKHAKTKMHVYCEDTVLLMGVLDEEGYLEEGEVLVGNGKVGGVDVVISRSPCNHPGDIRKARAKAGDPKYAHLSGCLVFSAKGARPLADMMAGGDLDGDEFYVIYDQDIVTSCTPVEPCNYGSWKADAPALVVIKTAFAGPQSDTRPPAIPEQLDVLGKMLSQGNVVGRSAGAWMHKVEEHPEGVAAEDSRTLAHIHQCALDGRKHGAITNEQVSWMNQLYRSTAHSHWQRQGVAKKDAHGNKLESYESTKHMAIIHGQLQVWIANMGRCKVEKQPHGGRSDTERQNALREANRKCESSVKALSRIDKDSKKGGGHGYRDRSASVDSDGSVGGGGGGAAGGGGGGGGGGAGGGGAVCMCDNLRDCTCSWRGSEIEYD